MNCPSKIKNGVPIDYAAGALDPAQAAEFEVHMESCAECRAAAEAQREVWRALDVWTPPEVSPNFDAKLYARISGLQSEPAWRRWARGMFRPAALGTACGMLVAGLITAGFFLKTPTSQANPRLDASHIDIEQVAQTLDTLEILTPPPPAPGDAM